MPKNGIIFNGKFTNSIPVTTEFMQSSNPRLFWEDYGRDVESLRKKKMNSLHIWELLQRSGRAENIQEANHLQIRASKQINNTKQSGREVRRVDMAFKIKSQVLVTKLGSNSVDLHLKKMSVSKVPFCGSNKQSIWGSSYFSIDNFLCCLPPCWHASASHQNSNRWDMANWQRNEVGGGRNVLD